MIYRVFSKYEEHETTLALCKDRETAESYVEYLLKEEKRLQKECYSMRRAFTFYDVNEILEHEDVIKILSKHDLDNNNYDYVDLGLPSGTLWATRNVGASSPEEYGKYFAWGEIDGYHSKVVHEFNGNSYKYGNDSERTKYNTQDGLLELELSDDAAHANMGGDWKMPTAEQIEELFKETNHEWVEDYQGTGINGRVFTSKTNGNTMFIPASGYRWNSYVNNQGEGAELWSSTLSTDYPSGGVMGYFYSDYFNCYHNHCYNGCCVRGVLNNKK